MIHIAREKVPGIDFRVGSCSQVHELLDRPVDVIVSNYALMDTPDLEGTIDSFFRVLREGGEVVLVFSHPCFPAGRAQWKEDSIEYRWEHSYFERSKYVDPPWAHFTSDFIWFHRPWSDYWRAFRAAGFDVVDFEEPRIGEERHAMAGSEKQLAQAKTRPHSVAFRLRKP
jgi:SAM-dependent methyltransferase